MQCLICDPRRPRKGDREGRKANRKYGNGIGYHQGQLGATKGTCRTLTSCPTKGRGTWVFVPHLLPLQGWRWLLGGVSLVSCPPCGATGSHRPVQALWPGALHGRPGEPQPPSSPTTSSWYKHSRLFTTSNSLLEGGRVCIIFQTRDSCIRVGHLLLLSVGTTRASDSASLRSLGEALLIRILADQKSTERKVLTYADPWGGGLITRSWLPRCPSLPHPQLPASFPFRAH